jgi:hypothetical protein
VPNFNCIQLKSQRKRRGEERKRGRGEDSLRHVIVSIPEECVTIRIGIASTTSGNKTILPRRAQRTRRGNKEIFSAKTIDNLLSEGYNKKLRVL